MSLEPVYPDALKQRLARSNGVPFFVGTRSLACDLFGVSVPTKEMRMIALHKLGSFYKNHDPGNFNVRLHQFTGFILEVKRK